MTNTVLVPGGDLHIGVVRAPRAVPGPLFEHIERIKSQAPPGILTIVIHEILPRHRWQHAPHKETAFLVKGAMLLLQAIVVNVPFHLKVCDPQAPRLDLGAGRR